MAMEINAGLERAIAVFEDGWASGAMLEDDCLPSYVSPGLREYWIDGFHAGSEACRGRRDTVLTSSALRH